MYYDDGGNGRIFHFVKNRVYALDATPTVYQVDGKQFVVIIAGGGGKNGTKSDRKSQIELNPRIRLTYRLIRSLLSPSLPSIPQLLLKRMDSLVCQKLPVCRFFFESISAFSATM